MSAATAVPNFVTTIATLSMPAAVLYLGSSDRLEVRRITGAAVRLTLLLGGLTGVILVGLFANGLGLSGEAGRAASYVAAFAPVYILSEVAASRLLIDSAARWGVTRAIGPAVYLSLVMIGHWQSWLTATYASALFVLTFVGQGAAAVYLLGSNRADLLPRYSGRKGASCLGYGARVTAGVLPQLISTRLDQVLLALAAPSRVLGDYALAASLSLVWVALLSQGLSAFLPRLTRSSIQDRSRFLILAAAVAALCSVASLLLVGVAITSVFGPRFIGALGPARILSICGGILFWNSAAGLVLRSMGAPGRSAVAEGLGATVTVIGLVALVPRYGAEGAALVSLGAYSITGGALVHQFRALSPRFAATSKLGH